MVRGLNMPQKELHAYAFINGMVVLVGKANMELDHGNPIWLCQTQPPFKQIFITVMTEQEAVEWLKRTCSAEVVYKCELVS